MWLSDMLIWLVRFLVGGYPRWTGCGPSGAQRIYFANHSSHLDTLVLWSALPGALRAKTRPVAARDYWEKTALRRYVALKALNAVFIRRNREGVKDDPLQPLMEALDRGDSLIIFPEGTRRAEATPGPFKSGLYHLANRYPGVELVPAYLENLHRSMPKGAFVPVPLICTVWFGAVLNRIPDEARDAFLARARRAVMEII